MIALTYLTNVFLTIIVGIFILRFLFQLVKADFRNPVIEVITKLTNPIILPLRKILPPLGKIDTASIVAIIVSSILMVSVMHLLTHGNLDVLTNFAALTVTTLRNILSLILSLYFVLILFHIIISWIQPGNHSPFTTVIYQLTEPVLGPARRLIPPFGGLDLSPIPVLFLISALRLQFGI